MSKVGFVEKFAMCFNASGKNRLKSSVMAAVVLGVVWTILPMSTVSAGDDYYQYFRKALERNKAGQSSLSDKAAAKLRSKAWFIAGFPGAMLEQCRSKTEPYDVTVLTRHIQVAQEASLIEIGVAAECVQILRNGFITDLAQEVSQANSESDVEQLSTKVSSSESMGLLTVSEVADLRSSLKAAAQNNPKSLFLNDVLWQSLGVGERETLGSRYAIRTVAAEKPGLIVDIQVLDESAPGTTGGAVLGSQVASARYVDRVLDSDSVDYSAQSHLRSEIVGGVIGSLFDSAPRPRFHFRYSVKALDGNLRYLDEVKSNAFRRTVGECVDLKSLEPFSANVCESDVEAIRRRYLPDPIPASASTGSSDVDAAAAEIAQRLRVIDELRKSGLITDPEYKAKREAILSGI